MVVYVTAFGLMVRDNNVLRVAMEAVLLRVTGKLRMNKMGRVTRCPFIGILLMT